MQSKPPKENVEIAHSRTLLGNAQRIMISVRHVALKATGQSVAGKQKQSKNSVTENINRKAIQTSTIVNVTSDLRK